MYVNPMKTSKICELVCFYLVNGYKVVGSLHLPPNTRITETMNLHFHQKPFVPITDARLIDTDGKNSKCPFMVINKNHIILCFPVREESAPPQESAPPGELEFVQ